MSRYITVETDIDIEDYIDELDYDVLLDECIRREPRTRREKMKRKELLDSLDFSLDDILDLFTRVKGLSLLQTMKLKDFIEREI